MPSNGLFANLGTFGIIVTSLVSIVTLVFWMVVAWRAMRAHERIAAILEHRLPTFEEVPR